jgi:hypothetical protein
MVPGFTFLNIEVNFNSTRDCLNRGMVHENATDLEESSVTHNYKENPLTVLVPLIIKLGICILLQYMATFV